MRGVYDEEDLEPVNPRHDTELTLGSGMLLAIFFGLVLLCGLCFGLGYVMGHRGAHDTTATAPGANAPQPPNAGSGAKPSAATQPSSALLAGSGTAPQGTNWSRALPLPNAAAPATPQQAASAAQSAGGQSQVRPALPYGATALPAAAQAANNSVRPALSPAGAFMVQIAAVSNQEDADVLTTALRRRGYAVTEKREPMDNLIHVRVGPFATAAEANTWKTHLLNDGYNAIVQ